MELVRTTSRNDLHLASRASSFRSTRIGGDRSELLYRVDRCVAGRCGELSRRLIVGVKTIDGDVALVGAGSGHGTDAVGRGGPELVTDHTGLQADQRCRRAADLDRKLTKLPC